MELRLCRKFNLTWSLVKLTVSLLNHPKKFLLKSSFQTCLALPKFFSSKFSSKFLTKNPPIDFLILSQLLPNAAERVCLV